MLVGVPPSQPVGENNPQFKTTSRPIPRKSLYGRATRQLRDQRYTYYMTASLSNTLLLSQVVLGAALTALGASASSHVLITLFGAANTIIAGLVAYLKSRGQPMRARMFLDDLERVVGEIENSEVMWLGITHGAHGYDEINTDEHQVTVRSEVARLTRLYNHAVNSNTANNPDMYMAGSTEGSNTALKSRPPPGQPVPLPIAPAPEPAATPAVGAVDPVLPIEAAVPPVVANPDESPVTAAPVKPPPPKPESQKEESNDEGAKEGEGKEDGANKDEDKTKGKEADKVAKKDESPSSPRSAAGEADGSSSGAKVASSSFTPFGNVANPSALPQDPDASPASDVRVPLKKSNNGKSSRLTNGEF
ncbi:hypothetical protein PT974_01638 [Cladobotryum mycophilum]|uniref:SMODS and SLOG-associating 2TM effector domain-containing protein n=1 Tax=Cladobotryum mycophilum TaxID=491253 RepID=A0ABR0T5I3_9HYPO